MVMFDVNKKTKYSFAKIPTCVFLDESLQKMTIHVYGYLSIRCFGDKKYCYPSHSRMTKDLSMSLSTVKRHLGYLEFSGLV